MQSFLELSSCAIAYLGHGYKLYDNADVTLKVLTILYQGEILTGLFPYKWQMQ